MALPEGELDEPVNDQKLSTFDSLPENHKQKQEKSKEPSKTDARELTS